MRKFLLASVMALAPGFASASTLLGDTVFVELTGGLAPTPISVLPTLDVSILDFTFDFNSGSGGDELVFGSLSDSNSYFGASQWIVSDLDFTDGSNLIGFNLLSTQLTGLSVVTTADSITFNFDGFSTFDTGDVIRGQYITDAAPIPLPATAPLLLLGAGGLLALRRRKANK